MIRSDGTLNPSGVRFGSAEIYNIVEQFPEVVVIVIIIVIVLIYNILEVNSWLSFAQSL